MDSIQTILKQFPNCTNVQKEKFEKLGNLYKDWNEKINLISRKDIDNLYTKHILHSLSIAKLINFKPGTNIIDVGTGGGMPGIPLAILFPEVNFLLVDSINKKIKAVDNILDHLNLNNVSTKTSRVENINLKFDFILGRAVAPISKFYSWVKDIIKKENFNKIENGILYLRGDDFYDELEQMNIKYKIHKIKDIFNLPLFENKYIVHIPLCLSLIVLF